jgi:hypothetical protein
MRILVTLKGRRVMIGGEQEIARHQAKAAAQ